MMIKKSIILIAGVALIMCGCKKENEVKCPGYLHLDKIDVVERADAGAPSPVGFLSSDVDAVQITAFWEGDEEPGCLPVAVYASGAERQDYNEATPGAGGETERHCGNEDRVSVL